MQPVQFVVLCLVALSSVTFQSCKKSAEKVQISCSFKSSKANEITIHSTLSPATSLPVKLTLFKNDSLVDVMNRTHNGDNDFTFTGLLPSTTYTIKMGLVNDPSYEAEPCSVDGQTTISDWPLVNTASPTNLTSSTADVGGAVTYLGLQNVSQSGVCWSTSALPTIYNSSKVALSSGIGSFSTTITGLNPNTVYHVRAYGYSSSYGGTVYGGDSTFKTLPYVPTPPTVTTTTATAITQTTATTGGDVTASGTTSVTARGVCWGSSVNPDITGNKTSNGTGTGSFVANLVGLTGGTTYHIRAYATNSIGTSYGADEVFTTLPISAPTVSTASINSATVTQTSATAGGNVSNSGGALVTALGVCYGTSANPDLTGTFTNNGSGTGSFTSNLSGLTPGTLYHVRAYATNSVGTSYGADVTFTTLP